jgi:hypothetical protein
VPRLRQNTRRLKERALNSLLLAIELFNRPQERGRVESTLLLLQHAFEMLLKAKIWEERGTISERRSRMSYTFDKCLGIARSDLGLLDEDEARTISILDGLRDCAAHNLLAMSEENLYLHVQAGVTLFAELLERSFGEHVAEHLPNRVLPISTSPPEDIDIFLDHEFQQIRDLLAPNRRQRAEAYARLRPLLVMEANLRDNPQLPTTAEVAQVAERLAQDEDWRAVFPGVSMLRLDATGHGLTFSVRLTREPAAAPTRVLRPGEEAEGAVLVREVNLLDRYSMGLGQLASNLGLSPPKTLALVLELDLQSDEECFKVLRVGKSPYKRYSPKALERLREALPSVDIDEVWQRYRERRKARATSGASSGSSMVGGA